MERGFTSITNPTDFKRWVLGLYGEWSDEQAKLPTMLADAQVARWQCKYGRDPTDQQRSWLLNKIRTDIVMMATKLNAQVIIKNLQDFSTGRICTRSLSRPRRVRGEGWNWRIRTGPACKAGDHTRADLLTAP